MGDSERLNGIYPPYFGIIIMAKKIVKPTAKEQKIITARLKRMYPQMYEPKATFKGLSPGDRKELERVVGKKLKKVYRKK